jgi:hydrogenase-4 component F
VTPPLALLAVFLPLAAAGVAWLIPSDRARPLVLPVTAAAHLALTFFLIRNLETLHAGEWVQLDALGAVTLGIVSVLFATCSAYAPAYLTLRIDRGNRIFCACMLVMLGMTSLIVLAQHLGLLWVAVEATTLTTAPLVYFNRNARSLEATWKYLMIGSVGIALALLGSFFLSYSAYLGGGAPSLVFKTLIENAGSFSHPWLRAGFVLLLVGYGTKMGLAPLHTWKPDVYGEAPGVVGALLAGGMTSCAFLALLRVYRIVDAAGEGVFARELLVFMGLLSIAFAAVFMVRQRDFKRMLAYSSVEHMGILVLGVGLGGAGLFGAILHSVNNGITKGVLFLAAGNIHRAFGSKSSDDVSGAIARLPVSGSLFLAGFFAITGSPPFGPFVSEFTILNAAIGSGRYFVAATYLLLLFVVFVGMGGTVLAVVQGRPSGAAVASSFRDSASKTLPIAFSMALVLLLGLWIPEPLARLLREAAAGLAAKP